MNSPNPILEETEGKCSDSDRNLPYGQNNNCTKKTDAENNPSLVTEHKIEEATKEKKVQ